jgi:hypothetical protein
MLKFGNGRGWVRGAKVWGQFSIFKMCSGCRLISHCPFRNIYETYIRTSSVAAPYHQAVSPDGA